jgi:hypothetical protein
LPISRSEFESGQILSDLEKRIISFLEKGHAQAFTSDEIMDGINFQTDFSNVVVGLLSGIAILGFPTILNNLVAKGKIRINIIKGQYYYLAK